MFYPTPTKRRDRSTQIRPDADHESKLPPLSIDDTAAYVKRFVAEAIDEILVTTMMEGDPETSFAARQRLLGRAEPSRVARLVRTPAGLRRDPRDLLFRIGADPARGRGMVRCPSHDDRAVSLSWRLSDDGTVLLHCFSGCTFDEIRMAAA